MNPHVNTCTSPYLRPYMYSSTGRGLNENDKQQYGQSPKSILVWKLVLVEITVTTNAQQIKHKRYFKSITPKGKLEPSIKKLKYF